jgi:3-oxoacyl-[acyl-carrier-protein] synthase-3
VYHHFVVSGRQRGALVLSPRLPCFLARKTKPFAVKWVIISEYIGLLKNKPMNQPQNPTPKSKDSVATVSPALQYAHVVGWGMAVPEKILTNSDLAHIVDTSDEWIVARTGIRERRIANEKETTASLATAAARNALAVAGIGAESVELIIVATATPDHLFPATASLVQDAIGASNAGAFDLSAACTGFVYALQMATQAIRSGSIRVAIVIGAETLSRALDWTDRGTCILFGDGAGAFVLQASNNPGGVLTSALHSDGSGCDLLTLPAGVNKGLPPNVFDKALNLPHSTLQMNGREVFRFATRIIATVSKEVCQKAGVDLNEVNWIVPHQANIRIIEAAAKAMNWSLDRFCISLDRYGNTSAASIPIAVCEAVAAGKIKAQDKIILVGFGGGLTWGANLLVWDVPEPARLTQWQLFRRNWSFRLARLRSVYLRLQRRLEGNLSRNAPLLPDSRSKPKSEK